MLCDDVLLIVFSYLDILRDIPRLVKLLEQVSLLSQITPTELTLCSTSIERDISTIELLYPYGCLNNVTCLYASNCKQSELTPGKTGTTSLPPLIRLAKCLPNLEELYLRNFKTDIICNISWYYKEESYKWLLNIKTIFNNLQVIDLSYIECNYYQRFLPGDVEIIDLKKLQSTIELIEYLEDLSTRYKIVTRDPILLRKAINSNELSLLKYCKYPSILDISNKNLKCNLDTLYSVLKRVPINEKHPITGTTIIQRIIERFTHNIIPLLTIEEYLPIILTKDYVGKTVLHYLVLNNSLYTYVALSNGLYSIRSEDEIRTIFDILLHKYSISIDLDNTLCTPLDSMLLHLSTKTFDISALTNAAIIIEILIENGCPITHNTIDRLSRCLYTYSPECSSFLDLIFRKILSNCDNNALMVFQKIPSVRTIEALDRIDSCLLMNIQDIRDENNRNALHTIIEYAYKHKKLTSYQLVYQISNWYGLKQLINQRDNNGQTPFHLATQKFYKQLLDMLIEAGADVNIDIQEGVSLLYHALYCNPNIPLARYLIANGHRLVNLNANNDCIWHIIERMYPHDHVSGRKQRRMTTTPRSLIIYIATRFHKIVPPIPPTLHNIRKELEYFHLPLL
jgi:ankyrin repeat protein